MPGGRDSLASQLTGDLEGSLDTSWGTKSHWGLLGTECPGLYFSQSTLCRIGVERGRQWPMVWGLQ